MMPKQGDDRRRKREKVKMIESLKKMADLQLDRRQINTQTHKHALNQLQQKYQYKGGKKARKYNKSSKDCTWSAVPDALLGVIS